MRRSVTLHAEDKHRGMTVGELRRVMDGAPDEAVVKVYVNMRRGIKVAEVVEGEEE